MRAVAVVVPIMVAGLAFPATAPADWLCTGAIGAVTISDDDVVVPPGAACQLAGTIVDSNVRVERGARLNARSIRVEGNVQAEGAARVVVESAHVGGNVQIEQGGGAEVRDTRVEGDIQLFSNDGPLQHVARNTVGGNIQVMSNRGGVDITGNRVDGNLQCKSNDPTPSGGGNVVQGNQEDQCASLNPRDPGGGGGGGGGGEGTASPRLADRSLRVRRGAVRIALRCPSGPGCRGRLTIRRRGAALGSARFNVAAGRREAVRVRLNRRGRAQVRRNRRMRVTIAIRAGSRTVRRGAVIRR